MAHERARGGADDVDGYPRQASRADCGWRRRGAGVNARAPRMEGARRRGRRRDKVAFLCLILLIGVAQHRPRTCVNQNIEVANAATV